ncbi:hypothetical protein KGQ20_22215 [Catenulispora sp. NF23]|uniref:Uncharacterized protein n=1 Tax=Catenulispora pinistramenti TaxID=2705254 RepID=A0ABS5KXF2_9ACTN|nr:hypothetical protein [Catenulispora pinistramenti]MBS2535483.1 hypothetical protein [Catenulispora pinistramenti]MBS2550730.1 hypothetical protein [Catenulispora pinistramenti]
MEGIIGKRILRCSDGHLFISSETSRLLLSLHFGSRRLMKCPVDGRMRMMSNVESKDLPESEVLRLIAESDG